LIWHWASGLAPVGLLYAGGGGTTFGNRITRVLSSAIDLRFHRGPLALGHVRAERGGRRCGEALAALRLAGAAGSVEF
jgi:hypothetical protein